MNGVKKYLHLTNKRKKDHNKYIKNVAEKSNLGVIGLRDNVKLSLDQIACVKQINSYIHSLCIFDYWLDKYKLACLFFLKTLERWSNEFISSSKTNKIQKNKTMYFIFETPEECMAMIKTIKKMVDFEILDRSLFMKNQTNLNSSEKITHLVILQRMIAIFIDVKCITVYQACDIDYTYIDFILVDKSSILLKNSNFVKHILKECVKSFGGYDVCLFLPIYDTESSKLANQIHPVEFIDVYKSTNDNFECAQDTERSNLKTLKTLGYGQKSQPMGICPVQYRARSSSVPSIVGLNKDFFESDNKTTVEMHCNARYKCQGIDYTFLVNLHEFIIKYTSASIEEKIEYYNNSGIWDEFGEIKDTKNSSILEFDAKRLTNVLLEETKKIQQSQNKVKKNTHKIRVLNSSSTNKKNIIKSPRTSSTPHGEESQESHLLSVPKISNELSTDNKITPETISSVSVNGELSSDNEQKLQRYKSEKSADGQSDDQMSFDMPSQMQHGGSHLVTQFSCKAGSKLLDINSPRLNIRSAPRPVTKAPETPRSKHKLNDITIHSDGEKLQNMDKNAKLTTSVVTLDGVQNSNHKRETRDFIFDHTPTPTSLRTDTLSIAKQQEEQKYNMKKTNSLRASSKIAILLKKQKQDQLKIEKQFRRRSKSFSESDGKQKIFTIVNSPRETYTLSKDYDGEMSNEELNKSSDSDFDDAPTIIRKSISSPTVKEQNARRSIIDYNFTLKEMSIHPKKKKIIKLNNKKKNSKQNIMPRNNSPTLLPIIDRKLAF